MCHIFNEQEDADAAGKFISDSLARITMTTDTLAAVQDTDLVIEAIVENLGVKQKLFKSIDEVRQLLYWSKRLVA